MEHDARCEHAEHTKESDPFGSMLQSFLEWTRRLEAARDVYIVEHTKVEDA